MAAATAVMLVKHGTRNGSPQLTRQQQILPFLGQLQCFTGGSIFELPSHDRWPLRFKFPNLVEHDWVSASVHSSSHLRLNQRLQGLPIDILNSVSRSFVQTATGGRGLMRITFRQFREKNHRGPNCTATAFVRPAGEPLVNDLSVAVFWGPRLTFLATLFHVVHLVLNHVFRQPRDPWSDKWWGTRPGSHYIVDWETGSKFWSRIFSQRDKILSFK